MTAPTSALANALRRRLARWDTLVAVMAVLAVLVATLTTPGFATASNAAASASLMSEKSLMVLPLVLLIIMREIDISVASIAGLCAVVAGMLLQNGHALWLAVVVALVVGTMCGAVNGLCVTVLGMPSLVVTLGTLALFRGLCYVLVGGTPTSTVPASLTALGNDNVPGVAVPQAVVPLIVLAPMFALALHRLPVGRRIFAIGGNPETARYAGVHLDRIRFCTFVVSGLVCAIAGVISIGRFSSASPDGLLGYELDAITVVFLGGVSVLGGQGRFSGVLWALVLLTCLRSAMQLHNVSAYAQGTAVGSLLIVSLLLSNTVRSTSAAVHARRRRRQAGAPPGRAPAVAPVTTQT